MTTATWNPTQYLQFAGERLRPALDLLNRIPLENPQVIYDLGCGAGTATLLLKQRWPQAQVIGVDSSPDMLEKARAVKAEISWQQNDLTDWQPPQPADLVYSNAALHWLDNHEALFPRLMAAVKPGGVLAVQMPNNFAAPTHTSITETAHNGPWRAKLEPRLREHPVLSLAAYYDLLRPLASSLDFWETTFLHTLRGQDPVVEWTKGSVLRPVLDALTPQETTAFLEGYRRRVSQAYPARPDGVTLMPFKRIFIIAAR